MNLTAVFGDLLKTRLQIVSAGLQLAGVVQCTVLGRSKGALSCALGKLELTVLWYIAAAVGDLRRRTLIAGYAFARQW